MNMCVKRGNMVGARHMFDSMPTHDLVSWNIMIMGYAKQEESIQALELFSRMQQEGVQPSDQTFVGALKACSNLAASEERKQLDGKCMKSLSLDEGRAIHSQVLKNGFDSDVFVGATLVDMYTKCGSMDDAQRVFDELPHRNVVSWNTMILGYAKLEEGMQALKLFSWLHEEGIQPTHRTFIGALKAWSTLASPEEGKQIDGKLAKMVCLEKGRLIHSQLLKIGFESDLFVGNTLVVMYTKCGSLKDARAVFDEIHLRNVVSWNAIILGYAEQEEGALALEVFGQMHQADVTPDHRTFIGALKACGRLAALEEGKPDESKSAKTGCLEKVRAIHSRAIVSGFESDGFLGHTLMDMYAKSGNLGDAQHIFDKLPHCDVGKWATMILGYAKQDEGVLALDLYAQMLHEGVHPSARIFVGVLKACNIQEAPEEGKQVEGKFAKTGWLEKGRIIHFEVVKSGFESDVFVGNTLVDMYAKSGSMEDALRIFDRLRHRDVVTWTAMILGYSNKEEGRLALGLYARMHLEGVQPNARTFVGVLKACSSLAALEEGKQVDVESLESGFLEKGRAVHSQVVESGFESDVFVGTTLVDMYTNCGNMEDSRHVFDKLAHRNVVTWNTMILGYAEQGESEAAFRLYAQMQKEGLSPSSFTFVAVLKACGDTAALEIGRELHSQVNKVGFETISILTTSLIDMYAKCGCMADAQLSFDALCARDLVSWNTLITGYAHLGDSGLVFCLFERMRQEDIQPNRVTFVSILTICSHAGLVNKGQQYFYAMSSQYCITPNIEHYTCMVDLLGRAGRVREAMSTVEKMPFQPDVVLWSTLLGACRKWKNVQVGRQAFESAVRLDIQLSAAYVLMANIYADLQMWEECDKIQVMRKNAQAWKKPGQSWWADLGGMVHTFVMADVRHPQTADINVKLKDLSTKLQEQGTLRGCLSLVITRGHSHACCKRSESL